jgi:hypothetical protein
MYRWKAAKIFLGVFMGFRPHNSVPRRRIVEIFEAPGSASICQPRRAQLAALVTKGTVGHRLKWTGGRKKHRFDGLQPPICRASLVRFRQTRCPRIGLVATYVESFFFGRIFFVFGPLAPKRKIPMLNGGAPPAPYISVRWSRIDEIFEAPGPASNR